MSQIDQAGLHRADGHGNVKIQARHVARLSQGEANNRLKTMPMLRLRAEPNHLTGHRPRTMLPGVVKGRVGPFDRE